MRTLAWLVVLTGCGAPVITGAFEGVPLVTLRGQISNGPGRSVEASVKLAMRWSEGTTVAFTQSAANYAPPYPASYTWSTASLPPANRLATGVLIAYRDANSNGALDEGDDVLGSSLGEADAPAGYHLLYVDGPLPTEPTGLRQGFNLVSTSTGVSAFSADVPVVLTGSPTLSKWVCTKDCGEAPMSLHVTGSLGWAGRNGTATLLVEDRYGPVTNAEVQVNGRVIAFEAASGHYSAVESNSFLLEVNTLTVAAPGYTPLSIQVPVPAPMTILEPATISTPVPFNASLHVAWSPVSGASRYLIRLFDPAFNTLMSERTTANDFTITAVAWHGALTLNVEAEGENVSGENGTHLVTYSNVSARLVVP